jgi:transposase, IS5 family
MTEDFFRSRLDQMIEQGHPLAVLAERLPWQKIEGSLAPQFAHKERPLNQSEEAPDLAGAVISFSGGKASNAGRPRLAMRLMIALTLLKNSFDLSDEELATSTLTRAHRVTPRRSDAFAARWARQA